MAISSLQSTMQRAKTRLHETTSLQNETGGAFKPNMSDLIVDPLLEQVTQKNSDLTIIPNHRSLPPYRLERNQTR